MIQRRLILLTPAKDAERDRLVRAFGDDVTIEIVSDLAALRAARIDDKTSLVSFGSGVIVPGEVLAQLSKPAYNMHAASPDFPGRDPHHHAVYRKAPTYGATLHVMTERVDEGQIIGVETFEVFPGTTPNELLAQANAAGFRLIERMGRQLLEDEPPAPLPGVTWGTRKTKRSDLQDLCRLSPLISEEEFTRRFLAFDGAAYDNLTLHLHGELFRIDKSSHPFSDVGPFEDFTELGFRELLRALKHGNYRFCRYGDSFSGRHVIWRHDVDFSMHRAARLAEIEAEEGAIATYFVNPRCSFYNLLEPEIYGLVHHIRDCGHEIGLHFDGAACGVQNWDLAELEKAVARERSLFEMIIDAPVRTMSWHNPDLSNLLEFDASVIGGLVNAYGAELRRDYVYCSDSNGYWRFQPMAEVIAAGHGQLHLLTHPAWWTPQPMSPSTRIDRAILGRARAVRRDYDALLVQGGRQNITR
jgi:hypothetical protein